MRIRDVDAYPVFDSRGNPTIEAVVTLEDGSSGRATVPSGASTGSHEAWELRDGEPHKLGGKSVNNAVNNVLYEIAPCLKSQEVFDQEVIDAQLIELDGTPNLSRLGANAVLGVSMACCVAAAETLGLPLFEYLGEGSGNLLPLPEIQIFGGGAHAAHAIDIQDFMVIALGAKSYRESLEMTCNVYHMTARLLRERGQLAGVADEGGFWPLVSRNEDVFDLVLEAIDRAGYEPGIDFGLSLDVAATDLYKNGMYQLACEQLSFSSDDFIELIVNWTEKYPIVSVEDPLAEDDWSGWRKITGVLGDRLQIVGDDLFTTNLKRIELGIRENAANAVLIKLNQIGTVTETIRAIRRTQEAGWLPVVSARSGETEDTFIAHLAVAMNAGQLKVGSFSRSERMAKWNEILRIDRLLGDRARYIGPDVLQLKDSVAKSPN